MRVYGELTGHFLRAYSHLAITSDSEAVRYGDKGLFVRRLVYGSVGIFCQSK